MSTQTPLRRKVIIVGDDACGKRSLVWSFALGGLPKEDQSHSYGNCVAKVLFDGKVVQLEFWDPTGCEEYKSLRPLLYSDSHVILIAFAIDTPDSLENVTVKWIEEVRSMCGPSIPTILVGCKTDLRPPSGDTNIDRYVSRAQAERVAQTIGARAYKECSALKNEGLRDVFGAAIWASMQMHEGVSVANHGGRSCIIC